MTHNSVSDRITLCRTSRLAYVGDTSEQTQCKGHACFLSAVLIMPKKCFITGDSMGIPVTLFKCQITFPLI